jgi:hypothetical protein
MNDFTPASTQTYDWNNYPPHVFYWSVLGALGLITVAAHFWRNTVAKRRAAAAATILPVTRPLPLAATFTEAALEIPSRVAEAKILLSAAADNAAIAAENLSANPAAAAAGFSGAAKDAATASEILVAEAAAILRPAATADPTIPFAAIVIAQSDLAPPTPQLPLPFPEAAASRERLHSK